LPDPLSPTRHSVSPLATCNETPSIMRGARVSVPRETMRSLMSRTTVMQSLFPRHCEEPTGPREARPDDRLRDEAIHLSAMPRGRMDCFASLAMTGRESLAALAFLHARIERVACGIADQIDAEDRNRQQQSRPEDQGWLDLKIGAPLRHDVAPGRRFRADAGAEERQDRLGEDGRCADVSALHDQRRNR